MNKLLKLTTAVALALPLATMAPAEPRNDNQLSDPRVRQAIAYAIDMETIAETLFEGAAIPALGLTSDPNNYPEGMNSYSYDPDRARELLAEAGWDSSRVLDMVLYYPEPGMTADVHGRCPGTARDVASQNGIPPARGRCRGPDCAQA